MSQITAILETQPDGTLHLPVPPEWRHARVKVVATLEEAQDLKRPTAQEAKAALEKLRQLGTFDSIQDPVQWQKELREDRPLPGRA